MISVMKIFTAHMLWVLRLSTRYWASTLALLFLSDLSSTIAFRPEIIPETFQEMLMCFDDIICTNLSSLPHFT